MLDLRPFEAEPAVTRVSRDILGIMSERFGVAQNDANHQIIEASFVTDPELIGGARMQSDEVLYDMTLSSSIKKLRVGIAK